MKYIKLTTEALIALTLITDFNPSSLIPMSSIGSSIGRPSGNRRCTSYRKKTTLKICLLLIAKTPFLDPLHPNISIHILYTFLYMFPLLLTRRICLTIKDS